MSTDHTVIPNKTTNNDTTNLNNFIHNPPSFPRLQSPPRPGHTLNSNSGNITTKTNNSTTLSPPLPPFSPSSSSTLSLKAIETQPIATVNKTSNTAATTTADTNVMMVGHNLASFTPTLPQPPRSPPMYSLPSLPSLPRPDSGHERLPVRLGLSDPRVHMYLKAPRKSVSAHTSFMSTSSYTPPRQDEDSLRTSPQFTRPNHMTAAPGRLYPSGTSRNGIISSSSSRYPYQHPSITGRLANMTTSVDTGQPIRSDFELYGSASTSPRGHYSPAPASQGHGYGQTQGAYSRSGAVPSTSPSPLPSPAPSLTMSPDWQPPCNKKYHALTSHQLDLLSPSCSEAELCSDSKTMIPLFSSSPPPVFATSPMHGSHLSPRPSSAGLGPVLMASSLSGSSSTSSSARLFDPAMDSRALSSPISPSLNWVSKNTSHPHHKLLPPIRAPERDGQDVMKTSSLETTSSEYINLDFYNIYRQNPRLLRPEGGRYEERRRQGDHRHSEDVMMHDPEDGNHTATAKFKSRSDASGLSRRQSMPLLLTATGRVLRNEDAKSKTTDENGSSGDVVHSLGIRSAVSSKSKTSSRRSLSDASRAGVAAATAGPSSSTRPAAMSIRHLLTDDTEELSMNTGSGLHQFYNNWGLNSAMTKAGALKRRSVPTVMPMKDSEDGEPPKRTRMSKKRAAEMGLLDEDGNIISSRKRTKKAQDPDHVSASGYTHGGERVVQEPEEVVLLEPDVGPVAMLNVRSPPMVHWKGHPLSIDDKPGVEHLHPHEIRIASTLRLSPAQYLNCKRTIILASREYYAVPNGKQFRKSDAQKMCRIDVNKTSRLWEVFARIGWLAGITEKDI